MTLAVVVATEPIGAGATAGLLYSDEGTVLDRLLAQLALLNVPDVRIITRPDLAGGLRAGGYAVVESAGLAGDLEEIAKVARDAMEPILILHGDTVANDELMRRVVTGAKGPAAAVTGPWDGGNVTRPPIRAGRHLVDSAGSRYHQVTNPTGVFRGVLRVSPAVAATLAEVAEGLAALARTPGGLTETDPVHRAANGAVAEHLEIYVDNDVDGALAGRGGRGWPPAVLVSTAPAGDDAPALLLTGLVRSGVRVNARAAGVLVCERALTPGQVSAARIAVERVDEQEVRLNAAVKDDDGFFTTYAVSSYSPYIVRHCARLHLTPNMVTSMSMAVGVVAAAWFAAGTRLGMVLGAILLYLAFVLDCVDGQLARYTGQFSTLGSWLDAIFDRAKEYVVYAGLAAGSTAATVGGPVYGGDVWTLAVAALVLQSARHMVDFSFSAAKQLTVPQPRPTRSLAEPGDGALVAQTPPGLGAPTGPTGAPTGPTGPTEAATRAPAGAALGRLVVVLSGRTEKVPELRWVKKIVILPIGERFALISITAALFNARVTFIALVAWGSLAAAYTLTGRVLRSRVLGCALAGRSLAR